MFGADLPNLALTMPTASGLARNICDASIQHDRAFHVNKKTRIIPHLAHVYRLCV